MLNALIQRIENDLPFLEHLQLGHAISLTEITHFLKGGLLEEWCKLSHAERCLIMGHVTQQKHEQPKLSYMIGPKEVVVLETHTSKNKVLCAVVILEALRRFMARRSELEAIQMLHGEMIQGRKISFGPIPQGAIQYICNQTSAALLKYRYPRKPRKP